jgi:ribonucleoside-diphosphate reductase alpha chain
LGIFTAEERAATVAGYDSGPTPVAASVDVDEQDLEGLAQSAPIDGRASHAPTGTKPVGVTVHSSAELLEEITGKASDAPLCMTCGIKMRPAGSCYVCEGCGSTSGCS